MIEQRRPSVPQPRRRHVLHVRRKRSFKTSTRQSVFGSVAVAREAASPACRGSCYCDKCGVTDTIFRREEEARWGYLSMLAEPGEIVK